MLFYITLSLTFTVKVCHTTSIGIFLTHFFKYYTQGIQKLLHYFMLKNSFWTLSIYIINNPHLVTVYALNYLCIIIKQISCMNTGHRKRVFCHCVQKECVPLVWLQPSRTFHNYCCMQVEIAIKFFVKLS